MISGDKSERRLSLTPFLLVSILLFSMAYPAINQSGYLDWIKPDPGEDDDSIDRNGTEPNNPEPAFVDSDGDGWSDEDEVRCGSNPQSQASKPLDYDRDDSCSSPLAPSINSTINVSIDDDFRILDPSWYPEVNLSIRDSDQDGWADIDEILCARMPGNRHLNHSNVPADIDSDGVCDFLDRDEDGDGHSDRFEKSCLSDWRNRLDIPLDRNSNGKCDGSELISWLKKHGIYPSPTNTEIQELSERGEEPPFSMNLFDYSLHSQSWWQEWEWRVLPTLHCSVIDSDNDRTCDRLDKDDDGDKWNDVEEYLCGTDWLNSTDFPDTDELSDGACNTIFEPLKTNFHQINESNFREFLPTEWENDAFDVFTSDNLRTFFSSDFGRYGYRPYIEYASNLSMYNWQQLNASRYWLISSNLPWEVHNLQPGVEETYLYHELDWPGSDISGVKQGDGGFIWQMEPNDSLSAIISAYESNLIEFFLPIEHAPSSEPFDHLGDISDFLPNDPEFLHKQWYFGGGSNLDVPTDLNLTGVWEEYSGENVNIGIIDRHGIEYTHPDLINRRHPNAELLDYNSCNATNIAKSGNNSHGTAVAGLALASGNNSINIAGAAFRANLISFRTFGTNCQGITSDDMMADVLARNGNSSIDVYISSTSARQYGPRPFTSSEFEIRSYHGRNGLGNLMVYSAGNNQSIGDNGNFNAYASSRFTIIVGAVHLDGRWTTYSEPGANLLLVTPSTGAGSRVVSLDNIGISGYNDGNDSAQPSNLSVAWFVGTSASAPMVGGIVGLMLEANPNLTWRDVHEILLTTTSIIDENSTSWSRNGVGRLVSHQYGYGLVDAGHAVYKALNWSGLPEESNMSAGQYGLSQTIPGNDQNWTEIVVEIDQTDVQPHKLAFFMESAEVHLDIEHQRRGDLEIRLVSPYGTESILSEVFDPTDSTTRALGSLNWTFTTVHNWGENALSQHVEEENIGKWVIKIRDNSSINLADGILRGYSLHLHGHEGTDSDGDGYSDYEENYCNSNASDSADYPINTDGLDWCDFIDDDDDNDGWSDDSELNCGTDSLDEFDIPIDNDGDGFCDSEDPDDDNDGWMDDVEQWCGTDSFSQYSVPSDLDQDGVCDSLDSDIDGDSFNNTYELYCLTNPYHSWDYPTDFDADGICDNLDQDDDNDSWNDTYEIDCLSDPYDNSSIPLDSDGGGLCDSLDNDDDNDLIPDWLDANPLNPGGIEDWLPPRPPVPGTPGVPPPWMDSDDDGVPDWRDPDYWYDEDNSDYPDGTDTSANPPPWVEAPR